MFKGGGVILLRADTLVIEHETHTKNLRVAPNTWNPYDWSAAMQFWGIGDGPIAFDYGSKTVRIRNPVDEAEARQIVTELNAQHSFPRPPARQPAVPPAAGWRRAELFAVLLAVFLLTGAAPIGQDKKDTPADKIPTKVMDALKARFPKARIDKWTREREADREVYDIEFKQDGKKFEADIFADGTFHNWERQVAVRDLPDAVTKTVEKKYPNATIKEVMAITAMKDGKEALEGYEIVLETADRKQLEITVAPNGSVLEDSGKDLRFSPEKRPESRMSRSSRASAGPNEP